MCARFPRTRDEMRPVFTMNVVDLGVGMPTVGQQTSARLFLVEGDHRGTCAVARDPAASYESFGFASSIVRVSREDRLTVLRHNKRECAAKFLPLYLGVLSDSVKISETELTMKFADGTKRRRTLKIIFWFLFLLHFYYICTKSFSVRFSRCYLCQCI